ncbi:MAG: hypothetical protein ACF8SC_06940 [Phycisphaerales bacterium JB037]
MNLSTPAPAAPVLTLTFATSLGTAVLTVGMYILTTQAHGYGVGLNYALALTFGVLYVISAMTVGRVMRALRARRPSLTPRRLLAWILALMSASCFVPLIGVAAMPDSGGWAWWIVAATYGPLTGAVWPIIESYVSGGRSGSAIHRATGRFNITWAGAMVVAFWSIAPLVESHQEWAVALLGLAHAASIVTLRALPSDPPPHPEGDEHQAPPGYRALLSSFRVLLPTSYLCSKALSPYLPIAMNDLLIAAWAQTPIVSVTYFTQTLGFVWLARTESWRGRGWLPTLAAVLLVAGFAGALVAPGLDRGTLGVALLILALALFGVALAAVYAGGLYYAMAVGRSEVDAGGTHEGLIGIGNAGGPVCGLGAVAAVQVGLLPERSLESAVAVLVLLATVGLCVYGLTRSRKVSGVSGSSPGSGG